jgi:hypothetical protein
METRDWSARHFLMPLPSLPENFHVRGEVLVSCPGFEAQLLAKQPQGINPAILLLDLHLVQKPGAWPQVMTWAQAKYDKNISPKPGTYEAVEVFSGEECVASIKVQEVK